MDFAADHNGVNPNTKKNPDQVTWAELPESWQRGDNSEQRDYTSFTLSWVRHAIRRTFATSRADLRPTQSPSDLWNRVPG